MARSCRRISALLVCAICALGAMSVIAIASPKHHARGRSGTSRSHRCRARAHARHRARHHQRCRAVHHRRTKPQPPKSTSGLPGSPGALPEGTLGTGLPGAPSSTPLSYTSGGSPAPAEGETPYLPPSIPHVQVTAVEYSFTLSRTTVPAGKVIFEFVNNGQDEHNLNVVPAGEGPVAGSFPDTPAKGVSDQTIVMRAGTYTMFCSLPEHEQKGMKATLVVE
jgi:plastocyanin